MNGLTTTNVSTNPVGLSEAYIGQLAQKENDES